MTKKVYVVHEDWANNDEAGWAINGVFDSLDKAKDCFNAIKEQATADGLAFAVVDTETDTNYVTYTDGFYEGEHYQIEIVERELNK